MHTYIHFGDLKHGVKYRNALTKLEDGRDELFDIRDVMIQMRDGNGSDAAHYTEVKIRFDFPDNAPLRRRSMNWRAHASLSSRPVRL